VSRDQLVNEMALDIKIWAQVAGLKRQAAEISELFDTLIRKNVPPEMARAYFLVSFFRQQLDEEMRRNGESRCPNRKS
jgi:hypothetical protein